MAVPDGRYVRLNLGPLFGGLGSHVPLNLGINWDDDGPDPPDPPEPVERGLRTSAALPWGRAQRSRITVASGWAAMSSGRAGAAMPWQGNSAGARSGYRLAWDAPPRVRASAALLWRARMASTRHEAALPWQGLPLVRHAAGLHWRAQLHTARAGAALPWLHPGLARHTAALPWHARLASARAAGLLRWLHPGLARRSVTLPWGPAGRLPWHILRPEPPAPPQPPSPFPRGDRVALNLGCALVGQPGLAPLNLGVTACYVVRPQQRTYIVINDVSVVRLPDRTPISVESLSISGNVGAWGYSLDMTLADVAHLALLKPAPSGDRREVEVAINGYIWTFLIEDYGHRREWGKSGASLTGRSRTALLASPYAPARAAVSAELRTVAQLADAEVADTGFSVSYNTVDWGVPAGCWYYDGATPLDALGQLAEASGAVVVSHPADKALQILPRYPASPWDWADTTPDHVLQDDIILGESGQVRSAPDYNAVVVTGELDGQGIIARIVRVGSAGDLYAPQATHALIVDPAPAAERGRNIISDRGAQEDVEISVPLFPQPLAAGTIGRVLPLELVEVQAAEGAWQGLCTAARWDVRRTGDALVVEQALTLERHYEN